MKRVSILLTASFLLIGLVATTADAFDGNRKGFVLGGGLGGGSAGIKQELTGFGVSLESDRETQGAFVSDFRIGGGFNEHWMLYYDNQVWWISTEDALGSNETFTFGIGLVGVSYYFTADAPSWYLLGTVGVASWGTTDEFASSAGFGLSGGVGFEFASHWSVEGVVGWGKPEETDGGVELTTDAIVFSIRVHGLAY
jgi:hypothetical protein